jgi:localization factor PodJL
MGRLERTEHTSAATTGSVEQTLRELAASVEAADQRNRDTVRELQAAVQDAAGKVAAVEEKLSAPQQLKATLQESTPASEPTAPAAANFAQPGKMILDAAPFADHAAPAHDFVSDFHAMPDAAHDFTLAAPVADVGDLPPFPTEDVPASAAFSEPFAASEGFLGEPESFLATARRSANAAAVEKEAAPPQSGMFPWTVPGEKSATAEPDRKRFAVAASVFAAAVAAALGGVVLTRGMGSTDPYAAPVAAISQPLSAHSVSGAMPTTAKTDLSSGPRPTAMNDDETPAARIAAPVKSDVAAVPPSSAVHETQTSKARLADVSARMMPPSTKAAAAAPKNIANTTAAPNSPAQRIVALANMGDSRAQLVLGMKYLEGSGTQVNEAEAARWLARAAQQGEPLAQYRLGTLYERGRGVPADAKLATHWYELAAKQGNRKAMHNLAVAFAEGSGESKDDAQAAVWFAHAANLGLADSQFNLAVLYERGMGVKQSLADAYKWYLVAAAQGDAESKSRAEALATQLNDSDRATAQTAAAAFKPQPLVPAANSLPVLG